MVWKQLDTCGPSHKHGQPDPGCDGHQVCVWGTRVSSGPSSGPASGPRPCRMLSIYEDTAAADLLQIFSENSGNFYAGMRDRSCELQAQESLFNKTTLFHDNK